ncbi:Type II secretion system (T2SS), protein F [Candidatus Anstonella stagnisolia]|nr:Type II secretion system (T2SS), protein F [Candidatus Anstonella stagnisolia]
MGAFAQIANAMPAGFFQKGKLAQTEEDLRCAGMELGAKEFLCACFFIPLLLLPLFFIVLAVFLKDVFLSCALALLLFAAFYLLLVRVPSFVAKKRADEEEADLPLSLGAMAIYIDLKMPFEKALEALAKDKYAFSRHVRGVLSSVKLGGSVQGALFARAAYTRSSFCKRALAQLALCYEGEGSSESLRRLAEEAGISAGAKTREFASKMSFLALLFIAVSALAPSFFAIFLLIAGKFLFLEVSAAQVWVMYALVFPLGCALVLGIIYASAPCAIGGRQEIGIGMEIGGRRLGWKESVALFALCMLPLLCTLLFYAQIWAVGMCALVAAFPFWAYFSPLYAGWRKEEELEKALPDALFHASSMLKGSSMEKIIAALAGGNYGGLSEKFSEAKRQVQTGASVASALGNVQKGANSLLFSRFCSLLLQAYYTGADMKIALRRAASDMLENFALVRERAAALSMQKYTLFFGGAIIVPVLLGSVLRISLALSGGAFSGVEMFGEGFAADNPSIETAIVPALHVYLALFALFCSILFGVFEGRSAQALLYFAILLPVSQMLFVLSYSVNLVGMVV